VSDVVLNSIVARALPESTLCVGGVCNLPECYIALRIPDGLSDMSFQHLCHWIETTVALAKKRRDLQLYPIPSFADKIAELNYKPEVKS